MQHDVLIQHKVLMQHDVLIQHNVLRTSFLKTEKLKKNLILKFNYNEFL